MHKQLSWELFYWDICKAFIRRLSLTRQYEIRFSKWFILCNCNMEIASVRKIVVIIYTKICIVVKKVIFGLTK